MTNFGAKLIASLCRKIPVKLSIKPIFILKMYTSENINFEKTNNQSSLYLQQHIKNQQYLDLKEQRTQQHSQLFFKRGLKFTVNPIQSESDNDSDSDDQTKRYLASQSSTTIHIPLFKKAIKKKPLIKYEKKSGRPNIDIIKSKKSKGSIIQKQSISWDHYDIKDLSKEILRINRESKNRNYEQIKTFFMDKINGKTKKHIILISGERSTGKKTILFDLLSDSELGVSLEPCFMSFEDEINSSFDNKIKEFYDFLKQSAPKRGKLLRLQNLEQPEARIFQEAQYENTIDSFPPIETINPKIQQQKLVCIHNRIKKIVIIDKYQNFIEGFRQKSLYNKFRNLVEQNIEILFIFIGNLTSSIDKQMLNDLKAQIFNFGKNSREYLLSSMLTYFQQYPFNNCKWILQRPLANFLCTKLEQNSQLKLSVLKKFIKFLLMQVKEINSQPIQRKVTRQIIDKFLLTLGLIRVKIDIQKLPFHQKAFLLAIYIFFEQNLELLIQFQQIKKHYLWICSSFSVKPKTDKQLFNESLYQLETYQLIEIKNQGMKNFIFPKIGKFEIRSALYKQNMFLRFFPQSQHSDSE